MTKAERAKRWRHDNPDRAHAATKKWYAAHRDHARNYRLMLAHGITDEEFLVKRQAQDNKCEICRSVFVEVPSVDHDHVSKKIRGLVCRNCNFILGHAHDSISVLENLISYLKKYGADDGRAGSSGVVD